MLKIAFLVLISVEISMGCNRWVPPTTPEPTTTTVITTTPEPTTKTCKFYISIICRLKCSNFYCLCLLC